MFLLLETIISGYKSSNPVSSLRPTRKFRDKSQIFPQKYNTIPGSPLILRVIQNSGGEKMVKGAWIINLHTMRCKNWVNGIEVSFHLDENGRLMGTLMSLPAALPGELRKKIPTGQEQAAYICRMWRRAIVVFYRAWYRGRTKSKSFPTVSTIRSSSTPGLTLRSSAAKT
jgi:hypothetical protein